MKSQSYKRLAFVAMLFSLFFVVTNATAKKPVKPPPDPDQTTAECIVFAGDLETVPGSEVVEDCCPNAGPFPGYAMTLDLKYEDGTTAYYGGPYDGKLFINNYGAGRSHGYIVQFWNDDICFEAIGGVIDNDKKSKFLTVSFNGEEAYFCETDGVPIFPLVSFTLQRTSDLSYCK